MKRYALPIRLFLALSVAYFSAAGPLSAEEKKGAPSMELVKPKSKMSAKRLDLEDSNGRPYVFDSFKGKVHLVHFWGTWCPPCVTEMPSLHRLEKRFKDRGFAVLCVAADNQKAVKKFAEDTGLKMAFLVDRYGKAILEYGVKAYPSSFLVGVNGNIEWMAEGQVDWSSREALEKIESLLNK